MKIARMELIELLKDSTATEIELVLDTPVRLRKQSNPLAYADVMKHTAGRYQFGTSYEQRVNAALSDNDARPSFVAQRLPWGHWVQGAVNKVIEHRGEFYLRYYNAVQEEEVVYTVNGRIATATECNIIVEFSYPSGFSKRQEAAGLLREQQVKIHAVSFSNITSLTIDGVTYKLV